SIRSTALIPFYTNRWKTQLDQAADHALHRVDVLGPTSDFLLRDSSLYGLTSDQILSRLLPVVEYALSKKLECSIGLIDATRAPLDRLLTLLEACGDSGASRLILYDSVGIMQPTAMKAFIEKIRGTSSIPILVHCHNDYGMATAN